MVARPNVYLIPEVVNGYEIDPSEGWISVVVPRADTNLDANPSYEIDTTGATSVNSTLATTSTYQRRGIKSMSVTPSSAADSGFYKTLSTLTGQNYCYSLDLYDPSARIFWIYFADTSGVRVGRVQEVRANARWQRVWVNFSEYADSTRRLYVIRKDTTGTPRPSTSPFYVDGSLIENESTPGTFFDGDSVGFVTGQLCYYWTGPRHASTSVRIYNTGSGGSEMKLLDLGFRLMAIIGLGLATFANVATPISTGGANFQKSIPQVRQFAIGGALVGNNNEDLERSRASLISALTPNRVSPHQELLLRYHKTDRCTGDETEVIEIPCVYQGGLEGNIDNFYQQRVGITFQQFLPLIYSEGWNASTLGNVTTVSNFANIGYRDVDGTWKAMGTGTSGVVTAIAVGPDGSIYAGGTFVTAGGVTVNNIAKWNGSAWSALGVTGTNGGVQAIVVAADGTLYVGGGFSTAAGVTVNGVAKWNGSAWSALGATPGVSGGTGFVNALAIGPDGSLYVGGNFTTAGGVTVNNVAKWNGSAWSALGTTGVNAVVYALTIGIDGSLYAGGAFTTAAGTTVNYVARWSGTAWSALGTGISGGTPVVYALAVGPDGSLYAGGDFTAAGGISANSIARWNGSTWIALSSGVMGSSTPGTVLSISVGNDGLIYISGIFLYAGGISVLSSTAVWVGNGFVRLDVDVQDLSANIYAIKQDAIGKLFIGGSWTGSSALSPTVTVKNNGSDRTWPVFEFTGPGVLQQIKNYSTGSALYFNVTLLASERAVLNVDPLNFSFTSSFRGDLQSNILQGSNDTSMYLSPGNNNLSVLMTGGDGNTLVAARWRSIYSSLDAVTR